MTIFEEVEKIIVDLPPEQALNLRFWLNEFQAARRYKHIKAYSMADKALTDFDKGISNAMWN